MSLHRASSSLLLLTEKLRVFTSSSCSGGQCITVFSAPNYVDQVGNQAGVVRIEADGKLSFTTFSAQPHPDVKPMACECIATSIDPAGPRWRSYTC